MKRIFMPPRISGSHIIGVWCRRLSANTQPGGTSLLYPFPMHSNPSALEIFHLSRESSASDIKKRYFELVRIYHPDTAHAQGIPLYVAEARFHAITKAYHVLQQKTCSSGMAEPFDSEAEEIKKRLASWAAADARRNHSVYDRERRERALRAESLAGKWWKSDLTLYYLLGGAAVAVAVVHVQGRSVPAQKERVKKYIEMKKRTLPSESPELQ